MNDDVIVRRSSPSIGSGCHLSKVVVHSTKTTVFGLRCDRLAESGSKSLLPYIDLRKIFINQRLDSDLQSMATDPFIFIDDDNDVLDQNAMTKSELINRLAERFPQLVTKDAEFAVKTILDSMSEAMGQGQRIEIRGFGSFALSVRPPRIGRNPKSGERVMVREKRVPHFKPGKELRERVDEGRE
jgi:integration host factor subunit beta